MHSSKSILSTLVILGTLLISPSSAATETDGRQLLRGSTPEEVEEHRDLSFARNCRYFRVGRCIDSGDRDYPGFRIGIFSPAEVVSVCREYCESIEFCRGFNILNDNDCRLQFDAASYNYNRNGELDALASSLPAGSSRLIPFGGDENGGSGPIAAAISIGTLDCYTCDL